MISSTHALGIASTIASSVFAALRAGVTTITFASPLPAGAAGSVSCTSSSMGRGSIDAAAPRSAHLRTTTERRVVETPPIPFP